MTGNYFAIRTNISCLCVRFKFEKILILFRCSKNKRTINLNMFTCSFVHKRDFFHAQLWQIANSIPFRLTVNAANCAYQHLQLTIFRLHSSIFIQLKMDFIAISVIFYGHFPENLAYTRKVWLSPFACAYWTSHPLCEYLLEPVYISRGIRFMCSILKISFHCKWSNYHSDGASVFAFQIVHTLFTCDRILF